MAGTPHSVARGPCSNRGRACSTNSGDQRNGPTSELRLAAQIYRPALRLSSGLALLNFKSMGTFVEGLRSILPAPPRRIGEGV